jgi:hypothetical protein
VSVGSVRIFLRSVDSILSKANGTAKRKITKWSELFLVKPSHLGPSEMKWRIFLSPLQRKPESFGSGFFMP